ncbi:MAG: PilZ domain-containing protein [Myxococcaceae bacterium]
MTSRQRNVLLVGLDPPAFEAISPTLTSSRLLADYIHSGAGAIELASFLPFDAIVAVHPLPDAELRELVAAVRAPASPSLHAGLVVVASEESLDDARALLGRGVNRVLSQAEAPGSLPQVLGSLIEVADRVPLKMRGQVELPSKSMLPFMTENVSASGMLVRTDYPYRVGMQLPFELAAPPEEELIRGVAEVVRATQADRERCAGVGARFVSFEGGGRERLERCVRAGNGP